MKPMISIIRDVIKGAGYKNISVYAAGSAFYIVLSAVPIIIVIGCVMAFSGLTEKALYQSIASFLPKVTGDFLVSLINYVYSNKIKMLPGAVILSVWSAGRGMLCLVKGLNEIHEIKEKRGYLHLRVVSSLYTILLILGLVITLVQFHFWLAIIMLGLIFTMIYTYVPDIETTFRKQFYGGCMAAFGCSMFSYGFSIYVDHYNDYSGYGSIKTVVIIMLWLYVTMYILLFGAYVGSYFMKEAHDED